MAEKTSAEVIIGGKVYTLSGYEGEEYLQKVAAYINNRMNELNVVEGFRRFPADMKSILVHLNIADDYFKARACIEKLEKDIEQREKELYDLKHDLVSSQIKAEENEIFVKVLEEENQELRLKIAELESAAADTKKKEIYSDDKKNE